jgi:hypothetical protein
LPEDFRVLPGTRGPASSPKNRVLRKVGRVIDQIYKAERMHELVDKMQRGNLTPAERSELTRIIAQFERKFERRIASRSR